MQKHTIQDIAQIAGVSPATVSRALNNFPGVRGESRRKILSVAKSLGYAPKIAMNRATGDCGSIIGIVIGGDLRNPFYAEIAYHMEKRLKRYGYLPVLFPFSNFQKPQARSSTPCLPQRLSGLILISVDEPPEFLDSLKSLTIPTVLLLNYSVGSEMSCSVVILDDFQSGYTATRHLIEYGHTKIAFLTGPERSAVSAARLQGYRQALGYYNIPFRDEMVYPGDFTLERGRKTALACIAKGELPTALICCNDLMAIGFLDECEHNGIKIPEEISVIGFNDIPSASLERIALTTMRQSTAEMGFQAVELLHKKISHPESGNEYVILDSQLIVRRTTGVLPADRKQK